MLVVCVVCVGGNEVVLSISLVKFSAKRKTSKLTLRVNFQVFFAKQRKLGNFLLRRKFQVFYYDKISYRTLE